MPIESTVPGAEEAHDAAVAVAKLHSKKIIYGMASFCSDTGGEVRMRQGICKSYTPGNVISLCTPVSVVSLADEVAGRVVNVRGNEIAREGERTRNYFVYYQGEAMRVIKGTSIPSETGVYSLTPERSWEKVGVEKEPVPLT